MKVNCKNFVEKSLKAFLKKKKIGFTTALLTVFLISGGIGIASSAELLVQTQATQDALIANIEVQKAEIQSLIEENEARLKQLELDRLSLINQGDWYSKPWYPSYFLSMDGAYKRADRVEKKWINSNRKDTLNDQARRSYGNYEKIEYSGSGWIMNTDTWNSFTQVYDNEAILNIIPTLKAPTMTKPTTPVVTFSVPNSPNIPGTPAVSAPNISPIALSVTAPAVIIPGVTAVALPNLSINVPEQQINVSLNPITINEPTINPQFNLNVNIPSLTLQVNKPERVVEPSVNDPNRIITPADPNATPYTNFSGTGPRGHTGGGNGNYDQIAAPGQSGDNFGLVNGYQLTGGIIYTGIDIGTMVKGDYAGIINLNGTPLWGSSNLVNANVVTRRAKNGLFLTALSNVSQTISLQNVVFHLAGPDGSYIDSVGGDIGALGFRSDDNVSMNNIVFNLYGKAMAIQTANFEGGKKDLTGSTVNIQGSDNTILQMYSVDFGYVNTRNLRQYRHEVTGELDVIIKSPKNNVFLALGNSGANKIDLDGRIVFEGASNIFYANFGYSPDRTSFGAGAPTPVDNLTSSIQMRNAIEVYGDENVIYFLDGKNDNIITWGGGFGGTLTSAPYLGIYQGQMKVAADIGKYAQMDISETEQTLDGNLTSKGYSRDYAEANVAVLARSGQRAGIIPTTHLGVIASLSYYDGDAIHGLQIGNIDVKFGRYSKDGFLVMAEEGTVVDIAKPGTPATEIGGLSTSIFDGIDYNTDSEVTEDEAATGTILAYSKGRWDQNVHELGSTAILSSTHASILPMQNRGSEINVYIPVTLTAKEGIAYFGDDYGIVNVNVAAITEATGHKSIIGYARNNGEVNIASDITAVDRWATTDLYENMGAYADSQGVVTVTGDAVINGIGAFANGVNSRVLLQGNNNLLNTGENGGLAALAGGFVEFGGGIINHKEISSSSHDGKTPFYADGTSSIDFSGPTTINISNGAVFNGTGLDFAAASGAGARYSGMGNITVELMEDGVNIGSFNNETVTWNPSLPGGVIVNLVQPITKVGVINENGKEWVISFVDGTFNIVFNTDFNIDQLKNVILEKEKINIISGITVNSAQGNSFVLGSNDTSTVNTDSQINNDGVINVTGGTSANMAVGGYVSFGQVNNNGTIQVDNGIGAYGVNGSSITNTGTINITSSGLGIVGLAQSLGGADDYGIDNGESGNVIEIDNQGIITVAGDNAVGIYAENNTGVPRGTVILKNSNNISVGDQGVGVMVKGAIDGGTIDLIGTGTADITVGKEGIGIYSENSSLDIGVVYGIDAKDDGVGIYTKGNSITAPGTLNFDYTGANTKSAAGVIYEGIGSSIYTNNLNINVNNTTNTSGTVVGLYAITTGTSDQIINNGIINLLSGGSYGIISENVDVINTNIISTGISSGSGGLGIFGRDISITTNGDGIVTDGIQAIGIYSESTASLTLAKKVTINQGTGPMVVQGLNGVGAYILDKTAGLLTLENNSDITLTNTTSILDRKVGIVLSGANGINENNGNITVGQNNLGIYNKNSNLRNTGNIDVIYNGTGTENLGIHNVGDNGNFILENTGVINVNGVRNIGISAQTFGSNTGLIDITGGTLNVVATSMGVNDNSIGIYAMGNNLTVQNTGTTAITVAANGIGIYMEGDTTSQTTGNITFNLSSDTTGRVGIGGYYKDGAHTTGSITVESMGTALDASGNPVRPIGIYYGSGSTGNISSITITATSDDAIGMYVSGINNFVNSGNIMVNSKGIGAYYQNSNIANNGTVSAMGTEAYGLLFSGGTSVSTGTIVATGSKSIGVISTGAGSRYRNQGSITSNAVDSIGMVAVNGGKSQNDGNIVINDGYGAVAKDLGSQIELLSGTITGGLGITNLMGVTAVDDGEVIASGGSIVMDDNQLGLYSSNGKLTIVSSNITVGQGGVGIYGKNGTIDLTGSTVSLTLGAGGIGLYSEDNILLAGNEKLTINYADTSLGIGLYYMSATPMINTLEVVHSGNNLVHIYGDGVDLINNANQEIQDNGIGIYGKNGAILSNAMELKLNGLDSVGIYLDSGSVLTNIGKITGNSALDKKVGIYVENGDITGTSTYDFDIDGGVGIYLKNNSISYAGTMNLSGNSPSGIARTIGIYADPTVSGNILANLKISGTDAVGLYLTNIGGTGSNITYLGEMDLTGTSTSNRGLGAYLSPNTVFTLGATGVVKIDGTNNIGFYASSGSVLNLSGGTINNTVDGILAYLDGGILNFTSGSPINIDYANVIVSGSTGQINNSTVVAVGNSGLQGDNGATIHNTITGVINGTTKEAKGMIGTMTGTTLINDGKINLSGDNSIGIYVENGAAGISTGEVNVGNNSVAYYSGAGSNLTISGIATIGNDSTLLYSDGGTINYNGPDIDLGKKTTGVIIKDATSIVDLNGKEIKISEMGTGIYVTGNGDINNILNIGNLSVGAEGTGIFIETGNTVNLSTNIQITGDKGIGILGTKDENITYGGNITSTSMGAMGIIAQGIGNISNQGIIELNGVSSIGLYGEDSSSLRNQVGGIIEIGSGTNNNSSIGIYGKKANQIANNGTITLKEYGVGIYGEGSQITNTGVIINSLGKNTGIYGVGGQVDNSGNIMLSDESNGIYLDDGTTVTNTGNIVVGDNNSSGIYGAGKSEIYHNMGVIEVGKNSVALATDSGDITVGIGAQIKGGESSTYIYSESGEVLNNADLPLSDYSIGMYTISGSMENRGKITLGKSNITGLEMQVSVGMATEGGKIENMGIIEVPEDYGIAMAVTNGGVAINRGTISVKGENAYGMQGLNEATLENYGTINVIGNNSRGITAIDKTKVINHGTIDVIGAAADGVYVESQSTLDNKGEIIVNGAGRTGIYIGSGGIIENNGKITINGGGDASILGGGNLTNVGDITINGTNVTIDGIAITNTGQITINGPLDFGTVNIGGSGSHEYVGTINAETFDRGEFLVLSEVTQGSNKEVHIVQYLQGALNTPNNGNINAISQSVSYVVDLQKDPNDSNKISLVLIKIPYMKMVAGTGAEEFGRGLDELYINSLNMELKMFDSLDMISEDDELAATFENEIRGNEYANIQDRMMDINEVFNSTYDYLRHDRLYTKDSLKIGLISSRGESKYSDPSIINYDQTSIGFMALKEYDTRTYGQKYGWHFGFAQNKFEFNRASKETVYSINLGMSYERILGGDDRLKWQSKGEITVNRHEIDRKIDISGSRYSNNSDYWSGMAMLRNKIRYEGVTEGGKIRAGIQGTFDMGYGKYFNIKESGDGMFLYLPATDMYTARPGVGADITFTARMKKGSKISLMGMTSLEYELGKIYDGANRVKFKDTSAGYYSLEKPKSEEVVAKVGAQLKYETSIGNSVGFEVTRQESRRDSTRYGLNFMMRFGK